jgi:hypothetical protein
MSCGSSLVSPLTAPFFPFSLSYLDIGPLILIALLVLVAIFSPVETSRAAPAPQATSSLSTKNKFDSSLPSLQQQQQPILPSHTKEGKPIDPLTLDYAQALQIAMTNYENEIPGSGYEIIEAGNKLAQAYVTAGFPQEAVHVCEQVLSVVEAEYGPISTESILPLRLISRALSELGMFSESVEYLTFLEGVVSELYGVTNTETVNVLMSLIGLYIHTGNVDSALIKSQQIMTLLESELQKLETDLETLQSLETEGEGEGTEGQEKDKLSEEYALVHQMIEHLATLGEMSYGCSMAWDRVEANPEGIYQLKRMRLEQQQKQQQHLESEESDELGQDEDEDEEGEHLHEDTESTQQPDQDHGQVQAGTEVDELDKPYTPYEIYRHQEHFRREVIHYRERVVELINRFKQQRIDHLKFTTPSSSPSSRAINPYLAGVSSVDSRAKLAQAIQQYAYLRYQHSTLDEETLNLFHQVLNISTDLALGATPSSTSAPSHPSSPSSSPSPSFQPFTEPSLLQYPINKDVAISLNNLGSVYLDLNQLNEAEHYIRQSLLIREELMTQILKHKHRQEDLLQSEIDLAMCKGNLGRVLLKREQWNEAEIELKEGINLLETEMKDAKSEEDKAKILPFLQRLQFQLHQSAEMKSSNDRDVLVEEQEDEEEEEK